MEKSSSAADTVDASATKADEKINETMINIQYTANLPDLA
jgi:hypothetical protein